MSLYIQYQYVLNKPSGTSHSQDQYEPPEYFVNILINKPNNHFHAIHEGKFTAKKFEEHSYNSSYFTSNSSFIVFNLFKAKNLYQIIAKIVSINFNKHLGLIIRRCPWQMMATTWHNKHGKKWTNYFLNNVNNDLLIGLTLGKRINRSYVAIDSDNNNTLGWHAGKQEY